MAEHMDIDLASRGVSPLRQNVENSHEPDEGLYSRQIYTIGLEAMRKMAVSNILVIGLKGLGVEIAKNIVLAGVKGVTVYDPELTTPADLSSQFFLSENDIGKRRDSVSRVHLAELNPYVKVSCLTDSQFDVVGDLLLGGTFKVVVATSLPMARLCKLNDLARNAKCHFIAADTRGLAAFGFCDFGDNFHITDVNGEEPLTGMIACISHEADGIVTCLDETRHGLQDGDYVRFSEVQGLDGINCEDNPFKVRVIGPYTFSIGDTLRFKSSYVRGGIFTEVKMPTELRFRSLNASIADPDCLITDFAKLERPVQLHIAFCALSDFIAKYNRPPSPRSPSDISIFFSLATAFASERLANRDIVDEKVMTTFAMQAAGDLCPMAAVLGGLMAQEVIKACSGKLHPIKQFFYFDAFECLHPDLHSTESECVPTGSRYDGQIAVFGSKVQEFIANTNHFLVGAGAIGCEMLKNWAMMGLATGPDGHVTVTDMDIIEKSNLNRQFLFRNSDVGKAKSDTAAQSARRMNSALKISSEKTRVGEDTENLFDDKFFLKQDVITNALDNVEARKYVDRRCVLFIKPLLDSGTLGVKGSTQVVLPLVSESYSSSRDPPEKSIPLCTLKNFPNQIEHTIQWARDLFEGLFVQQVESATTFLNSGPQEFVETLKQSNSNVLEALENIKAFIVTDFPRTFDDCVAWARLTFDKVFVNNIKQLLFNFPKDTISSNGLPFWSGPKRAPKVFEFDAKNKLHLDFIYHASILRAKNFSITPPINKKFENTEYLCSILSQVSVPAFEPVRGVKIAVVDSEAQASQEQEQKRTHDMLEGGELDQKINSLIKEIRAAYNNAENSETALKLRSTLCFEKFEKDNDKNHHIDVIAASSNIRAASYSIAPADRHKTKLIAGKIIPAIATTTAMVTGLVCLELYKILTDLLAAKSTSAPQSLQSSQSSLSSLSSQSALQQQQQQQKQPALPPFSDNATRPVFKIERYRNSFLTLAGPDFAFSEPIAAQKQKLGNVCTFTLWDRFEFNDMPVGELLEKFKKQHNLEITMLSCGVTMLFSFFMNKQRSQERLGQLVSEAFAQVSKRELQAHERQLVLEMCANDETGEDVETPYILIKLSP